MADNEITIIGNLTREPELRFTGGGTATCGFGVAVNRRYQQNGEWVDAPTNFFNVTVWGQYGENVAASLSKGDRVLVKGRLDFRKYQNKDGIEVSTHDIIADEVAPSLKYATAQMTRIERSGGQGGQGGGYQGGQGGNRQGGGYQGGGGGGYQQGGGGRPADPVYGDEEPF
ncbi:MAG: single-stranded DNA-binding protein [Acidimicrobiales bacterium]|nr:single-stranded DNA-binding protein [Acidimicrobiales bacterium]MCB9392976.1 single-stranded DNA-binding protein [Acidimicrobiaceae bacterium]